MVSGRNKLLSWLVIILLVANAFTITMFWTNKKQGPPKPNMTPREILIKELKLDEPQQEQLEKLIREHRSEAEQIRRKIREAKDSMFSLVKIENVADSEKQQAVKKTGKLAQQLDLITVNHFQKVRKILRADQQKKFDEIIMEVTAMMGRPPHRPGGPPPPRHNEGPPREN